MIIGLTLFGITEPVTVTTLEETAFLIFTAKQRLREHLKRNGFEEVTLDDLRVSFDIHTCYNITDHTGRVIDYNEKSLCVSGCVSYNIIFKITAIRISRWIEGTKYGKAERQWKLFQNTEEEFAKAYKLAIKYQETNRRHCEKN